jgi:hypothetical protein
MRSERAASQPIIRQPRLRSPVRIRLVRLFQPPACPIGTNVIGEREYQYWPSCNSFDIVVVYDPVARAP